MLLEFGCKGSANEWKNKIYFDFSRMQHNLHGPKGHKGSANRRQNKEIFSFFVEMQPTFMAQRDIKVVQMSGKTF